VRAQDYLPDFEIATHESAFQAAGGARGAMQAIRTHALWKVDAVRRLVGWPTPPTREWSAGFLAGIFDAGGSYGQGVLRIGHPDEQTIGWVGRCMRSFGFAFAVERHDRPGVRPTGVVTLKGGLREHLRFFHTAGPAIARKQDITGQALGCDARLRVKEIEPLGKAFRLYDITTETGDFIANGVVSHNCYARPSHAYLGLSPGIDFETRLFAKDDAARLLREELARPGYRCEAINIGSNTDGYQPIERGRRITRSILEVLRETSHPVAIVTKSALVERDLDLLAPMAREGIATVVMSVTTLDSRLSGRMEPRASAPARRLEAIRRLSAAGVPVGVNVAPIIPFLTDHEIEAILEAAAGAGASWAGWTLVRLPWEVKDLFRAWLEHHVPLKAAHVMSRLNEMRGGRDNDPRFGTRMSGEGLLADLLHRRFDAACRRLGLDPRPPGLARDRFRPPAAGGQLGLF